MKRFHCDRCGMLLTLENDLCTRCGLRLSLLPEAMRMVAWDQAAGDQPRLGDRTWRPCRNATEHAVCNWAIADDDPGDYCLSCRLTRVIPDLGVEENLVRWRRLEAAKRRLLIGLVGLGLLTRGDMTASDPPMSFQFLADVPGESGGVLTGHADGLITINIAEADDAERERRRVQLGEPYRTIVGHLRHECGHHYWERLIRPSSRRLARFRERFGDERADYGEALQAHYANGPAPAWSTHYVSAYAASHPWEDWAETWAHYLHMIDSLETAFESGLWIQPRHGADPAFAPRPPLSANRMGPFRRMIVRWMSLTYVLNDFNRGLGLQDAYPFVLSDAVLAKLEFVHETVGAKRRRGRSAMRAP
jgi:hypothetical protein